MSKKVMKLRLLLFIFVICYVSSGYAIAEEALTWQDCVKEARKNNPDLISSLENVKVKQADERITRSPMLPQLDSGVTAKQGKASGAAKATKSYSYDVTGQQLLFDGFKISNDVGAAKEDLRASQYDYAVVSSEVRLNLRVAFAGLMKAQDLVYITEEIAERRKQNLSLVKLRYEGGRENIGSLLTAEADMAQAEFDIEQAKRSISLSQRELSKQLGLKMSPLIAEGDFSLMADYNDKPDLDTLADTTPFLMELIAKKDAARYSLKSARADFFPKVYLNGSAGKANDSWPPAHTEWSAGFSMSFPLFEGGRRLAQVSKSKSLLEQRQAQQQSGRDTILVTLERSWKDLKDSITNVSVQGKFLKAAEERAKITRAQYSIGLATFNDWVIIEDNLVKAKKTYLNARADMLYAEAYWVQAMGGTLEYDEK